tara:strand:- start:90 stop:419 length:330 start_codon:yes stop_codon:yes gene_type:complete
MAYDAVLAERLRVLLQGRKGITEARMFGGVAYLLNGHICCGVRDELLLLNLGEERVARTIGQPHVREIDFTAKTAKGIVGITVEGYRSDEALRAWVSRAVAFVIKLPPK